MINETRPLWQKIDRKAEQASSQQDKVRRDADQNRRKHDNNRNSEEESVQAKTSIDAIILFLKSALPHKNTPQPQPQAPAYNQNTQTSRAASAYASTAGTNTQPPPQQAPSNTGNPDLSPEDIKTVHALIKDLQKLKSEGHQTLRIQEGHNFLNSLLRAIRRAKIT